MKITNVFFLRNIRHIKIQSVHRNLSLVNKSLSTPYEMNINQLASILHTAIEFKNSDSNPDGRRLKIPDLQSKCATLLLRKSNEMLQAPFNSAGQFLRLPVHTIIISDWDKRDHVMDIRRIFEKHTDCLFCESQYVTRSQKIVYGSPIPVIFVKTYRYAFILGLAQLMTIYLNFGRLEGLNILWIGPPCLTLNTFIAFSSMLCINVSYCCGFNVNAPASPASLENIKQQCLLNSKTFNCQECNMQNLTLTANDADVILTTKQESSSLRITKRVIKAAKPECIILHTLHRGSPDIDDETLQQENCLVWEMVANMKWIYAALLVRLIQDYEHTTPKITINCEQPKYL